MGISLLRAARAWRRLLRDALAPHGLTPTEFLVLDAVERLAPHGPEGTTTQQMVADELDMDKMSVSQTMTALDKRHLVERGEGYMVSAWGVYMTDQGHVVLKRALGGVRTACAGHFGALARDTKFAKALRRIGPRRKPAVKPGARRFGWR